MQARILLADDHNLVRQGFKAIISQKKDYQIIGEAENGREAIDKSLRLMPEIVIMDILMPHVNGILATEEIKRHLENTKIIILSMYKEKQYVLNAFVAGAMGYLLKDAAVDELLESIDSVLHGHIYISPPVAKYVIDDYRNLLKQKDSVDVYGSLTAREKQMLQMIAEGKTTNDIASISGISPKTVKTHRNALMRKLDLHDIASLTRYALQKGLITIETNPKKSAPPCMVKSAQH